jgi:hypothetical protein
MSSSRGFHRAQSNRPSNRVADAWAGGAIRMKAPIPTSQIQTPLTNLDALIDAQNDSAHQERLNGPGFEPAPGY